MSRKGVEYLIAKRCSGGAQNQGFMEHVAAIAVALSIIVMIVTLAVVMGFKRDIEGRLTALSGDMVVTPVGAIAASATQPITRSAKLDSLISTSAARSGVGVKRIAPFVVSNAILRGDDMAEGVMVKGIDESYDIEMLEGSITAGEMPHLGGAQSTRSAMVSRALASEMQLTIGDKLELLLPSSTTHQVKRELYRLGAIFSAGIGDAERQLILADMRTVQRAKRWGSDQISGYEVWFTGARPLDAAGEVATLLNHSIIYTPDQAGELEGVVAYDVKRLFSSLFDWLAAHDVNGLVIITIMVIVAAFNIITALLVMVLERTQMIGILKALGMNNSSVRRVFLYRAMRVTVKGLLWGNAIGVVLVLVQDKFGLIKLDEQGYLLSVLPVELHWIWLALLNIGVVVMILLMATLPTRFATTIEPTKAIKYQ